MKSAFTRDFCSRLRHIRYFFPFFVAFVTLFITPNPVFTQQHEIDVPDDTAHQDSQYPSDAEINRRRHISGEKKQERVVKKVDPNQINESLDFAFENTANGDEKGFFDWVGSDINVTVVVFVCTAIVIFAFLVFIPSRSLHKIKHIFVRHRR
ncbi:MAG: hypothetical protein HQM09_23065 [Candidatus Riflebacteria bacterium]|nr:hypothetical protein [Candidatus Riflebacteria bacterium]